MLPKRFTKLLRFARRQFHIRSLAGHVGGSIFRQLFGRGKLPGGFVE